MNVSIINNKVNTRLPCAGIKTTICVKDPKVDEYVSGGILRSGVWEKEIVTAVMETVDKYPEAVFLDIGANIGQFLHMENSCEDTFGQIVFVLWADK